MKRLLRSFRYGEVGFTLIELLVVIAILAALAGVVTLAVTRFIGKGAREACLTEEHNLQTAVSAWRAASASNTGCPTTQQLIDGGFILKEPKSTCNFDSTSVPGECVVTCSCPSQ